MVRGVIILSKVVREDLIEKVTKQIQKHKVKIPLIVPPTENQYRKYVFFFKKFFFNLLK